MSPSLYRVSSETYYRENVLQQWDEQERRNDKGDRREFSERRLPHERRFDYRQAKSTARRSIIAWVRSLANARLGVDRRKKEDDRRRYDDRRSQQLRSILTPEELADLLHE